MKLDIRREEDRLQCRRATVYLDSVKVPKCVMADEEAGVVEFYQTNDAGQIVLGPARRPIIVQQHGAVRIELADTPV